MFRPPLSHNLSLITVNLCLTILSSFSVPKIYGLLSGFFVCFFCDGLQNMLRLGNPAGQLIIHPLGVCLTKYTNMDMLNFVFNFPLSQFLAIVQLQYDLTFNNSGPGSESLGSFSLRGILGSK